MKVFVAFVVLATIVNIVLANAHHKKHHNTRNHHHKRDRIDGSYVCTLCEDCQAGCQIYQSYVEWGPEAPTTQPSARKRLSHHSSKHHKRAVLTVDDSTTVESTQPTTTTEDDNTVCCDCECSPATPETQTQTNPTQPDSTKRKGHSKKAHHSRH